MIFHRLECVVGLIFFFSLLFCRLEYRSHRSLIRSVLSLLFELPLWIFIRCHIDFFHNLRFSSAFCSRCSHSSFTRRVFLPSFFSNMCCFIFMSSSPICPVNILLNFLFFISLFYIVAVCCAFYLSNVFASILSISQNVLLFIFALFILMNIFCQFVCVSVIWTANYSAKQDAIVCSFFSSVLSLVCLIVMTFG